MKTRIALLSAVIVVSLSLALVVTVRAQVQQPLGERASAKLLITEIDLKVALQQYEKIATQIWEAENDLQLVPNDPDQRRAKKLTTLQTISTSIKERIFKLTDELEQIKQKSARG